MAHFGNDRFRNNGKAVKLNSRKFYRHLKITFYFLLCAKRRQKRDKSYNINVL